MAHTWPALFFTRWITHFCAPLFFFLAGTGACMYQRKVHSAARTATFLWTRGLWLVLLEFTIIEYAWTFTFWQMGGVIWSLGCCITLLCRCAVAQHVQAQEVGEPVRVRVPATMRFNLLPNGQLQLHEFSVSDSTRSRYARSRPSKASTYFLNDTTLDTFIRCAVTCPPMLFKYFSCPEPTTR